MIVNSADAAIAAAEQGLGIARVLSYQVTDAVAAGRLLPVLDALAPPPVPIHLVYQPRLRSQPNLRAFIDAARARFAGLPPQTLDWS